MSVRPHYLESYERYEDAVAARKEAEAQVHEDVEKLSAILKFSGEDYQN